MSTTKFQKVIRAMSDQELGDYANSCGTSSAYIIGHLLNAYKVPRRELMSSLVVNSGGQLTRDDLLAHFYPVDLFYQEIAA